jgi:hypothetical protein
MDPERQKENPATELKEQPWKRFMKTPEFKPDNEQPKGDIRLRNEKDDKGLGG